MAKKINICQIDAFTDKPFSGNSAGVTFVDGLTNEEMQLIAREMNVAETAFLFKSGAADYNLRWFTPVTEVELCGHATIASLHFLFENGYINNNSEIKFDTLSGILKCRVKDGKYFMQIPDYSIEEYNDNKADFLAALSLTENDIDKSIPFIITGNRYLYVYIKSLSILKGIRPNFKDLLKLQKQNNIGGNVVFTRETYEKENFAHSRFFAPYCGIDEDPVTGSANGPLLQVLNAMGFINSNNENISLTFEQGDITGRPGRVGVNYSPSINELFISGSAVTVLRGEMTF
jgi:PhzF family phenazine biosynthesis protein